MKKEIIALLPMRGGSERVINKNLKKFNGEPLYHHILKKLLQCKRINKVVIDTDSLEIIKNIKYSFNEMIEKIDIIERPQELIGGSIPMNKIINHDISFYNNEYFLQTHSTNPNLSLKTLEEAIDKYFEKEEEFDSLVGVTELKTRLYDIKGKPINHNPLILERTQDLESVYEENSNIYIFSKKSFRETLARIGIRPQFFKINKLESMDIDYIEDFYIAEMANKLLYGENND